MRLFDKFLKTVNVINLEVLGAGGAVWAVLYAMPSSAVNYFCDEGCSGYNANAHMFTVLVLASLATVNAGYQKYHEKDRSPETLGLLNEYPSV